VDSLYSSPCALSLLNLKTITEEERVPSEVIHGFIFLSLGRYRDKKCCSRNLKKCPFIPPPNQRLCWGILARLVKILSLFSGASPTSPDGGNWGEAFTTKV
jgi:hypothetical protein